MALFCRQKHVWNVTNSKIAQGEQRSTNKSKIFISLCNNKNNTRTHTSISQSDQIQFVFSSFSATIKWNFAVVRITQILTATKNWLFDWVQTILIFFSHFFLSLNYEALSNFEHDEFVCLWKWMQKNWICNKTNIKSNIILVKCIRHFLLVLRNVQCSQFTIIEDECIGKKSVSMAIHYATFGTMYHFYGKMFIFTNFQLVLTSNTEQKMFIENDRYCYPGHLDMFLIKMMIIVVSFVFDNNGNIVCPFIGSVECAMCISLSFQFFNWKPFSQYFN